MTQLHEPVGRERAATVHDVARVAGVSAQTVSRLLKGSEGIRPKTRERVEAAIRELSYRPNQAARLLRTRKSTRIGAVVHELFAYGPAQLLRGAAARAAEAGYSLNMVSIDAEDDDSIRRALSDFEEEQVAGVLAVTLTDNVRQVVEDRLSEVPILVDPVEAHLDGPSMNELGAGMVARRFAELGHRRVGVVGGLETWLPARQRREGFVSACAAAGISCVRTWNGDWSSAAGSRAAAQYAVADGVTAIFCVNDATAIGLMHGLAARGVSVPGDVSVAGFDAIPEGEFLTPPLSTVQADYLGQGRVAIDALLAQIDSSAVLPAAPAAVQFMARSSTGPRR